MELKQLSKSNGIRFTSKKKKKLYFFVAALYQNCSYFFVIKNSIGLM